MSRLDAVVWVADGEVSPGLDWGNRIVERLTEAGLDVARRDLTTVGPDETAPPAALHILSGGATSAISPLGWMVGGLALTRRLVEAAPRRGEAVLGICLGAQMIGEALWPGTVRRRSPIRVGLTTVDWQGSDHRSMVVSAFHYEALDRAKVLAGGGRLVASGGPEEMQGFRYGSTVWGLQFHPELAPDDVRQLVRHHRRTIEDHGGDLDSALRSVDELEPRWRSDVFPRLIDEIRGARTIVHQRSR